MSTKKSNCDRNLTLDYEKELVADIEELQPKIIAAINDKTSHHTLNERVAMRTGRDLNVKYVGYTLDKETGKKFPTYKVSLCRNAKEEAAAQSAEEKKKFLVEQFMITAWVPHKDTGVLRRIVDYVKVWSDEDLANRPEDSKLAGGRARSKAIGEGWFLSDADALASARRDLRKAIAKKAIELEYDDGCVCRHCVSEFLRAVESSFRNIDMYEESRNTVLEGVCCSNRPDIMPDEKEWDEFEVVNGKFQRKAPNVEIQGFELDGKQSAEIAKILSSITGEKVDTTGARGISIKKLKKN